MSTLKKLTMLLIEIAALFLTLSLKLDIFYYWIPIVLFFAFVFLTYTLFKFRFKRERTLKTTISSMTKDVLIFTVVKNDVLAAKRFTQHYGKFSENFHVLIFDDSSTDGTYEYLLEASKRFKNVEVRKLVRSQRMLHPKGEGLEKALKEEKYDFVFLCDGDSLISPQDLNFLVSIIEKKNLDYVSAQRRNTEKGRISYYSADVNEIFMSIMDVAVKFFGGRIFPGSGHLLRRKSFGEFKYEDICLSDDTYIGIWILEHRKKGEKFYSVPVKELVPEKFSRKLSQMIKWTKNGVLERLRQPSVSILAQYFLLFATVFSLLIHHSYLSWITYSLLAPLLGITFGAVLAFKKFLKAVIGFTAFVFELILSTLYNLYLYNVAVFGKRSRTFTGNFKKTA